MPKNRQLTKREYLGEGYIHCFKNDETDEIVFVPCTKEEYERLGLPGGSQYNPTLAGHTWVESYGGTVKVDTPNTMLGFNEYCIVGEKVHTLLSDKSWEEQYQVVDKLAVSETGVLDETQLISYEEI
jgi:hypothetical protein